MQVSSDDGEMISNSFMNVTFNPNYVAVDEAGNVYVTGNNSIQKISARGELLKTWDMTVVTRSFGTAMGIDVDGLGNVYVVSESRMSLALQVHVFTSDGEFNRKFDLPARETSVFAVDRSGTMYVVVAGTVLMFTSRGESLRQWTTYPSEDDRSAGGRFDKPLAIDVDDSGHLYAQDGRRVEVFSVDVTSP